MFCGECAKPTLQSTCSSSNRFRMAIWHDNVNKQRKSNQLPIGKEKAHPMDTITDETMTPQQLETLRGSCCEQVHMSVMSARADESNEFEVELVFENQNGVEPFVRVGLSLWRDLPSGASSECGPERQAMGSGRNPILETMAFGTVKCAARAYWRDIPDVSRLEGIAADGYGRGA